MLYWFVLSTLERPRALLTCSLSYFHLGTFYAFIGRLFSSFETLRGGLAEVTLGFLVGFVVVRTL